MSSTTMEQYGVEMLSTTVEKYGIEIPIGYERFHPQDNMNYQMNRFYHLGYLLEGDIKKVAPNIKDLKSWQKEFTALGKEIEQEGRLLHASFSYRAAEFFTYSNDPQKKWLYEKFLTLFYEFFKDEKIEKITIPYEGSFLHALKFKPKSEKKGTVVVHGGGDSFVEEFFTMLTFFPDNGYELIMFDGPGQGTSLHKYGYKMTYQWEKPASAVLDYFQLDDVTLIGISLGGYLAPRAAAFDTRIKRVVAFGIIGDFLQAFLNVMPFTSRVVLKSLLTLKAKGILNKVMGKVTKKPDLVGQFFQWWLMQTSYMWDKRTPFEVLEEMKNYNSLKISPLIKGDVLLLTGEEDIYTPFYEQQVKSLTNARSVEGRIFTKEENASMHCQVGNVPLALEYILNWIEKKS